LAAFAFEHLMQKNVSMWKPVVRLLLGSGSFWCCIWRWKLPNKTPKAVYNRYSPKLRKFINGLVSK